MEQLQAATESSDLPIYLPQNQNKEATIPHLVATNQFAQRGFTPDPLSLHNCRGLAKHFVNATR
jgi:hypothetical protein